MENSETSGDRLRNSTSRSEDAAAALLRLGKNIRILRIERNISQEDLAHRAGLHRTHISQIERGHLNISLLNLLAIANAFELEPSELLENVPPVKRT